MFPLDVIFAVLYAELKSSCALKINPGEQDFFQSSLLQPQNASAYTLADIAIQVIHRATSGLLADTIGIGIATA